MDSIAIIIAFRLGFASRQVGLPLLVRYLVAGFVLKAIGVKEGAVNTSLQLPTSMMRSPRSEGLACMRHTIAMRKPAPVWLNTRSK